MQPANIAYDRSRIKSWFGIALVAAFLAYQAIIWLHYFNHYVASGFAAGFDQVGFLSEIYKSWFKWQQSGWQAGIAQIFDPPPATGFLLQLFALFNLKIFGLSRTAALAVNLGFFIALLITLFKILKPKFPLAFYGIFLAYLLTLKSLYRLIGGMADFRLDFAGLCLLAMFTLAIWRSNGLQSRKHCIVAGVLLILICLTRTILVYQLVAVCLAMLVLSQWLPIWLRTSVRFAAHTLLRGIGLTLIVSLIGIAPYLYIYWQPLKNYYVVGHLTGSEASIRLAEQGIHNGWDWLIFYINSAFKDQLGTFSEIVFFALLAAFIGLLAACRYKPEWQTRLPAAKLSSLSPTAVWALIVIFASLMGHYIVLTLGIQKSPVVSNVFLVGLSGLLLWLLTAIFMISEAVFGSIRTQKYLTMIGVTLIIGALGGQAWQLNHSPYKPQYRAAYADRLQMVAAVKQAINDHHLKSPRLFVDHIGDHDAAQLNFTIIEHYQTDPGLLRVLTQIYSVEPQQLWSEIHSTPLLILHTQPNALPSSAFPFDLQMNAFQPELLAYCAKNCRKLYEYNYMGKPLALYLNMPVMDKIAAP